ncbi:MAG: hypothetical protein WA634_20540 [Silvibacterium sp.]
MSVLKDAQLLALLAVLTALAGCATNRVARCEGHLVAINPPPPKPAMAAPAPTQKSTPRSTEKKP